ncbi:uncharacterized protein I303_108015 [Kwoniella dejecticola CBS 10117]|uniref:Uncharacterized protein n=1 Tax=Kwoniella dejecticola CBS 10117 TaxID=1296121 RepID=A0A1A5ZWA7_9TREE|nr:uncharacterized protein I303_08006 [Kwoniella dejecticola CBS 10117]OBR82092.1 hypothetical protein I303_08006 [Kwoniella dejecticola CBS 10117]
MFYAKQQLQKRSAKYTISIFLISVLALVYYTYVLSPQSRLKSLVPFHDKLPLVTLIGIYEGPTIGPATLPYFLQSVGRNAHALDLLIVQRRGCSDLSKWTKGLTNIKHICMSEETFWGLHSKYFCKKWGGCTSEQKRILHADLLSYGQIIYPQSLYPILRGWVFEKYIRPETVYWGFVDFDTTLGDFSQTLPYDIIEDEDRFDILMPFQPNNDGPRFVFMRGHMTFIRNSPETERRIMGYPDFTSFDTWDKGGLMLHDWSIEEANYSSFVVRDPSINILGFDGLAHNMESKSSSAAGILTLPNSLVPKTGEAPPQLSLGLVNTLSKQATTLPLYPSWTEQGVERPITLIQGKKPKQYGLWFAESKVNWYQSEGYPKTTFRDLSTSFGGAGQQIKWKRFVIKLNNEWKERVEPMREFRSAGAAGGGYEELRGAYPWLYAHWQGDKRQAHFRELPQSPVGDIFVNYLEQGNAVYDSSSGGRRIIWVPRREETCDAEGCVPVDEVPIHEREQYKEFRKSRKDQEKWLIESKKIRMGLSTATLPPDPGKTCFIRHSPQLFGDELM